jgi:hypothetical protein
MVATEAVRLMVRLFTARVGVGAFSGSDGTEISPSYCY